MSSKEHILAGDLLQRHRAPSGHLRFIRRHDLDFLLSGLGVSVASIRAKRSQFPAETQRAESWQAGEGPRRRKSCETKPMSRGRAGMGEGRQGRPCRYRWAKTCKTKPIPPEHNKGQVLCGPRVMTHWTRKEPRPNKANPRTDGRGQGPPRLPVPPGTKHAKQSQFPPRQQWASTGNAASAADGTHRTKRSQFPHERQWTGTGNAASTAGATKRAKRSQFAPHRPEKVPAGRASTKQSQFPGSGRNDTPGTCHCDAKSLRGG